MAPSEPERLPFFESQVTMFRSWRLGRAFGIPLYVHPTFLLLVLWVFYQSAGRGLFDSLFALAVVLAVFGCVVLHELGHALMARRFGIQTRDITLYPIGGVARLDRMSEKPHEELCIALAGPAVNVVSAALLIPLLSVAGLAGLSFAHPDALSAADDPWTVLARLGLCVMVSNIILVLFNLIPAFPMDGGRVLRAVLSMGFGQVRATDIASRLGLAVALVLGLLSIPFGNPFLLLVSLFVAFAGQQERLAVRYLEARRQQEQEPLTVEPVPVTAAPRGFSGVAWDNHYRVWVRWVDGRPVGYYAPAE
jgi:Zn-dependent protease